MYISSKFLCRNLWNNIDNLPKTKQVDAESLEIHGISHDAVKFQCAGCGLKMESYSQVN